MTGITAVSRIRPGATIAFARLVIRKGLIRNVAAAVTGATVTLSALATPVNAQQIAFTGNGTFDSSVPTTSGLAPGAFSFSFFLPQNPTPDFHNSILFNFASATGVFTQGTTSTNQTGRLTFFTGSADGGVSFRVSVTNLLNNPGPSLFTGPTSDPTFMLGTYNGFTSFPNSASTLTDASITSTPEPGTMALLGTGLIGLMPAVRARRRNQRNGCACA